MRRGVSKFGLRDAKAWRLGARIIGRTFLRSTLRVIQPSVLHHISTTTRAESGPIAKYSPELASKKFSEQE